MIVYLPKRPVTRHTDEDHEETWRGFRTLVNMAPAEIEGWLAAAESRWVGQDRDGGESIGHKSGKKIIALGHEKKAALTDTDYERMQKVISYITRRLAQRPEHIRGSNWLYSLKNWGRNPQK